ncbi:unnamed protein product [Haemonchus placei]|uniref:C2H2-type domain-containing protein n=1 Tax=Haemonchus placei TaxID=6290 RepID=A0A0N4X6P4_HAEPC|nr:unnamed protein product [Haemonchus placei]
MMLSEANDSIPRNQFPANLIVRHLTVNVERDTVRGRPLYIIPFKIMKLTYRALHAIPSLSELSDHIKAKHEKALIVCVYCKSVFGKANDMTENQWKRLKTHMYGELVYAKLAEMQD